MKTIEPTLAILRATPSLVRPLLESLGHDMLTRNYGEGTFSPYDVLGHLILGERIDWLPRIRIVLEHGTTRTFDPFPWDGRDAQTAGMTLADRLNVFEQLRTSNLSGLAHLELTASDLERSGMHPRFGEVTIYQLISTWGVHDLHHVAQTCKAVNYQFRDAIGPWRPYVNSIPSD